MNGTLLSLLIVESVLTAIVVVMFLYRGMLDLKEEDHVILNDAESHLAREQKTIRHKLAILSRYLKVAGVAWSVLAVAIFGVWVAQGLNLL
ncbi:MAG TPA: hypothetical protein VE422_39440 [Terriglobia bacterium]|nr:hypothetical protein [Terriglobia bacterium]